MPQKAAICAPRVGGMLISGINWYALPFQSNGMS